MVPDLNCGGMHIYFNGILKNKVMGIYGLIGILVLLFAIFSILTYYIANKDFLSRKFESLMEKNKWRKIIYFVPFGPFWYIIKVKNRG